MNYELKQALDVLIQNLPGEDIRLITFVWGHGALNAELNPHGGYEIRDPSGDLELILPDKIENYSGKEEGRDWRRAFTRLVAKSLNAYLDTGLDIVDTSKNIGEGLEIKLEEKEIAFLLELSENQMITPGDIANAIEPIADSLEMTASVLIKRNHLEVIFRG